MTREIKFRSWDKILKIMSYNPVNAINFNGQILLNDGKFHDINKTDYILMQYTGLVDKNGKKIFEGDIISCQLFCPESNNCWITNSPIVVEWEEYGYDPFIEYGAPDHSFLVEIIGDIYQNPELLNEEKND